MAGPGTRLKKLKAIIATAIAASRTYAKAVLAALGLALSLASAFVVPGTTAAVVVSAAIAVLTVFGVYQVPNQAALAAAINGLKAIQAARSPKPPTTPGGDGLQDQIRAAAQTPPAAT